MKVLTKVLVGSRLHGLHTETSDYDYRGIHIHTLQEKVSPFKTLKNTTWIEGDEDNTSYELAYWKLIPEMPYAVTSATTMPTRDFVVAQKSFSYYTIQRAAYTGYILCHVSTISEKYNNVHFSETDNDPSATFLIAEPEKALADFLYFVALGKKMPNDRLSINTTQIDAQKLWQL